MAPRLGHNKSRRGCVRCKTRKVKCDETRPQCLACSRHHLACEYDQFQHLTGQKAKTQHAVRSKKAPPRQSSVTNSGTEESETPFGILSDFYGDLEEAFDPDSRRVLELRLLHYFSVVVAPTFPATESNDASSIWICEAIFLALDHSFLLNAIFAIAAQHAALGIAEGVQPASVNPFEPLRENASQFQSPDSPIFDPSTIQPRGCILPNQHRSLTESCQSASGVPQRSHPRSTSCTRNTR